jgi:hypothetical protein
VHFLVGPTISQVVTRAGPRIGETTLGVDCARRMKGLKYQAAAQAVKRFGGALAEDAERRRSVTNLRRQLSII